MPYPRCPQTMRTLFPPTNDKYVYIDWRMVLDGKLPNYQSQLNKIGFQTKSTTIVNQNDNGSGKIKLFISFDQTEKETEEYCTNLALSKYFIANIRRVGQSLVDAASLQCICIGNNQSSGHKTICHPFCFVKSDNEVFAKILKIESDPDLQTKILAFQDAKLQKFYVDHPVKSLSDLSQFKKKHGKV